jgi:RimJ/RimL family protein N-acetyltransferase
VRLRDVQPADLPVLFAFEREPAWRAVAMVKPRSAEVFEAVWAAIFKGWAAGETCVVQRTILADGEVCGVIGCRLLGDRHVVGYGLGQAYWGRGIASRALGLLLAQVLERPLYATAAAGNTASIRVLTKHGFVISERRTAPETERCPPRDEVSMVLT